MVHVCQEDVFLEYLGWQDFCVLMYNVIFVEKDFDFDDVVLIVLLTLIFSVFWI